MAAIFNHGRPAGDRPAAQDLGYEAADPNALRWVSRDAEPPAPTLPYTLPPQEEVPTGRVLPPWPVLVVLAVLSVALLYGLR